MKYTIEVCDEHGGMIIATVEADNRKQAAKKVDRIGIDAGILSGPTHGRLINER